jgi:hypothetical protein
MGRYSQSMSELPRFRHQNIIDELSESQFNRYSSTINPLFIFKITYEKTIHYPQPFGARREFK